MSAEGAAIRPAAWLLAAITALINRQLVLPPLPLLLAGSEGGPDAQWPWGEQTHIS